MATVTYLLWTYLRLTNARQYRYISSGLTYSDSGLTYIRQLWPREDVKKIAHKFQKANIVTSKKTSSVLFDSSTNAYHPTTSRQIKAKALLNRSSHTFLESHTPYDSLLRTTEMKSRIEINRQNYQRKRDSIKAKYSPAQRKLRNMQAQRTRHYNPAQR